MSDGKKIYAAMCRVMKRVEVVGKNRKNPQQGYSFRGIDDVVAHCQMVLAEEGVCMAPKVLTSERELMATKSGGSMVSVRLLVEHTFFADDGSSVIATTVGEAMDSGDKASNKAQSAALKYALTETFLIPTYEVDRDTEEHSPEVQRSPPAVPAPRSAPPPAKTEPVGTSKNVAAVKAAVKAVSQAAKSVSQGREEPPPPDDSDYRGKEVPF